MNENRPEASATAIKLAPYPFDWSDLEDFSYPLDERHVPQVDMGPNYGLKYNPITIAQFGLFKLQQWAWKQEAEALFEAQNCVSWLLQNLKEWRPGVCAWIYDFDLNFYGPKAPWISGMAQGQGLSLLLRAHQIQPIEDIELITKSIFQAFYHPVTDGGVQETFADGALIFEEFTTRPPSRVLNGHLFALLGIYDFAFFWQDRRTMNFFKNVTDGLAQNLENYDTGFWNLYDLHSTKRLASPMYMQVHIRLLKIFAELTANETFFQYAQKWERYAKSKLCRVRWVSGKIIEKIRLR